MAVDGLFFFVSLVKIFVNFVVALVAPVVALVAPVVKRRYSDQTTCSTKNTKEFTKNTRGRT